jgi:hypothetical protein
VTSVLVAERETEDAESGTQKDKVQGGYIWDGDQGDELSHSITEDYSSEEVDLTRISATALIGVPVSVSPLSVAFLSPS